MPSRASSEARGSAIASAACVACEPGSPSRRPAISALAVRTAAGPAAQHGRDGAVDRGVERRVVGVHLVHEADREGVRAVEQLAA